MYTLNDVGMVDLVDWSGSAADLMQTIGNAMAVLAAVAITVGIAVKFVQWLRGI